MFLFHGICGLLFSLGLEQDETLLSPSRIAVRINDRTTPFFGEDLAAIVRC